MFNPKRILSPTAATIAAAQPAGYARKIRINTHSYRSDISAETSDTVEIPEVLQSQETLEFIGFRDDVAKKIFDRFMEDQQDMTLGVGSFAGYIEGYIESAETNAQTPHDDWNMTLWSAGLKPNLITSILDPEFDDIRFTRSAFYWAKDTVFMRFEFLQSLDAIILAGGNQVSSAATGRAPGASTVFTQPPTQPSGSRNKPYPPTGVFPLPAPQVGAVASQREIPENHTRLYKGESLRRLKRAMLADGGWDCTLILSNPPADFSRHERELYFTKQREVARRYSVYAWRRALRDIDVGIMELDVDREWLNENAHYIHGEEWKEYVWINRTEGQMPDHLKYLNDTHVLGGPLCASQDLGESCSSVPSLRLAGGDNACQYRFRRPVFDEVNGFTVTISVEK
ncbi:hypothetical protein FN846DRAFT_886402 [Sphaerosporella brunnea]|uniref:Uncharacterized protein n=1 Tax=Sphaerosporella brunnea TaxID=1250544 RepID=A0A5J5FAG1_9PEZI|nr:hypothetical protein FN846DRAFT_886402 [Sphaerosporella brunnea]